MPEVLAQPIDMLAHSASPMALVVLDMGLAKFGFKTGWREGSVVTVIKGAVMRAVSGGRLGTPCPHACSRWC